MARNNSTSEPWRVGVLFSQTGVTSVIEESQLRGTLLAIEEVNAAGGINGRELAPIIYDPGSESHKFARFANRLLTEDGVVGADLRARSSPTGGANGDWSRAGGRAVDG